jgi:hypothetical protein
MRSVKISDQLTPKTSLKGLEDQSRTYQPPIDGQMTINRNQPHMHRISDICAHQFQENFYFKSSAFAAG